MTVILRIRTLVSLARPAVLLLVLLSAAAGLAAAGAADRLTPAAPVAVAVTGFVLFAVTVNDLADEAVDRVNLQGVPGRLLVEGRADRREMILVAVVAAAVALAAASVVSLAAIGVVAAGLVFALAYSLPPIRLSGRGALASLLLPAGFVAVPFVLGLAAGDAPLAGRNAVLLAGLYVGFIGRILLKDFRDVVGDALFGKRTFLVRHGREVTCRISGACWLAGTATLAATRGLSLTVAAAEATMLGVVLVLLHRLCRDLGPRRDELVISAVAILGRGMVLVVIAHLAAVDHGWSAPLAAVLTVALTTISLGDARAMLRYGPLVRLRVPGGNELLAATESDHQRCSAHYAAEPMR